MGKTVFILFFGSLLLFLAVLPRNHSEAEDAFEYSRLVEEGQGAELFHPHHMLYLSVQKSVFKSAQMLGYEGRSYYTVRAVSLVSGSLALCLFYLIALKIHNSSRKIPMIGTFGLLFSYGFIRYACEVEIYLPTMVLMLSSIYSALRGQNSGGWFFAGVVFSSMAVLMHTISSATALVVVPCVYLLSARLWKRAVIHLASVLFLIGFSYWFISNFQGISHPQIDAASEGWLQPGTVGKAITGLGQCLLSGNFLFAYDMVTVKLQQFFPYRVFAEELFAAAHLPQWIKFTAPLTFLSALIAMALTAVNLVVSAIRRRCFDRRLIWIAFWLGGTMFPTLMLEPSNPELWVLALAPLWLLFVWFLDVVAPSSRQCALMVAAVLCMGLHNLAGGMGSVRDRDGDYNFRKAEWLILHADADDVIHTADSFVYTFYLNYWSDAEVRNVNAQSWSAGQVTYVHDDVFNPPAAIGVRYPEFARKVRTTAEQLRPICTRIHSDQFGGMWIVNPKENE